MIALDVETTALSLTRVDYGWSKSPAIVARKCLTPT
jgi:hypothetical protein